MPCLTRSASSRFPVTRVDVLKVAERIQFSVMPDKDMNLIQAGKSSVAIPFREITEESSGCTTRARALSR